MSKGSAPRPLSVPRAEFEQSFDRIFGGLLLHPPRDEHDKSSDDCDDPKQGQRG